MNRFRKEEISASSADHSVPATPFSWSVSRHLLFRKCLRAYYLHYYYAQGGWDPYADEMIRFVWYSKKNLCYEEWLEKHLEEILRFSFDRIRQVPVPARQRMLGVQFQSKLTALSSAWAEKSSVWENHFSYEKAYHDLTGALRSFQQSEICEMLCKVQGLTLFHRAFKPSFQYQGTELWYNPGLIWREGVLLISLRTHFRKPSDSFIRAESDMFALSAKHLTGSNESVSIFRYPVGDVWKETERVGNVSHAGERFRRDRKEMLSLLRGDQAYLSDFPKDERQCSDCRFSGVCAAMTERFGEI